MTIPTTAHSLFLKQDVINFPPNSQLSTALNSAHSIRTQLPSISTLSPPCATSGCSVPWRHATHCRAYPIKSATSIITHKVTSTPTHWKQQALSLLILAKRVMVFNAENVEKTPPCNFNMQYLYTVHITQWNSHIVSRSFLHVTTAGQVTAKGFLFAAEAST